MDVKLMMMMVRRRDGRRSVGGRYGRTVRYVTVGTVGGLLFGGGNLNSLTELIPGIFWGIPPEFKIISQKHPKLFLKGINFTPSQICGPSKSTKSRIINASLILVGWCEDRRVFFLYFHV